MIAYAIYMQMMLIFAACVVSVSHFASSCFILGYMFVVMPQKQHIRLLLLHTILSV